MLAPEYFRNPHAKVVALFPHSAPLFMKGEVPLLLKIQLEEFMKAILFQNFKTLATSVVILGGLAGSGHAATTIFSDNFDTNLGTPMVGTGPVDASTTGTFTVTGGNVDMVGPNYFPNLCTTAPESGTCVDMDGSVPAEITSSLLTLNPGNYTLTFDIFGNERGSSASTTVTLGSFYNVAFTNEPSSFEDVVTANFTVTTATTGNIVFTSNDPSGDDEGNLIDNVALSFTPSVRNAAPEPASAGLLLAALPLAWLVRHNRRRSAQWQ